MTFRNTHLTIITGSQISFTVLAIDFGHALSCIRFTRNYNAASNFQTARRSRQQHRASRRCTCVSSAKSSCWMKLRQGVPAHSLLSTKNCRPSEVPRSSRRSSCRARTRPPREGLSAALRYIGGRCRKRGRATKVKSVGAASERCRLFRQA